MYCSRSKYLMRVADVARGGERERPPLLSAWECGWCGACVFVNGTTNIANACDGEGAVRGWLGMELWSC